MADRSWLFIWRRPSDLLLVWRQPLEATMMRQSVKTRLLVISDLHLGGSPATGDKLAFQMCTAAGRAHLVRFIEWAARPDDIELDIRLVIAGDVVDFLAEEAGGGFL